MIQQPTAISNQRGLTLIEIIAAMVLLSIVILLFSNLFSDVFKRSADEQAHDEYVVIARTVMEEMKIHLPNDASPNIELFGQSVSIGNFRTQTPPVPAATFYYPDDTSRTYTVTIRTEPITDYSVVAEGNSFDLRNYFRKVIVEVYNPRLTRTYTLESLIEYNQFSL